MIYRLLAILTGLGIAYVTPVIIERHPGPLLVFADLKFRTPYCTFWQAMVDASLSAAERRGREEISAASRLVENDGELGLWQTPRGPYWIPQGAGEVLSIVLAQQDRDVYGDDSLGVRQGDIVFDCGAHVGVYAKKALSAGAKLVVAVEPTPVLVECIRRNLADEIAAGRVIVSAKGVWDRSGELTLFGDGSAGAGNSFVAHGSDLEAIGQIPVTTIDTLVSELELPRVDFIKADVKGATERMILGATETLARHRPRMALSTEEPPEDPQQLVQVVLDRRPDYQFTCGPCLTHGVKQVYTDVVFFH